MATAAYDGLIRIWSYTQKKGNPQLLQTLTGHSGHINSLVFDDEGSRLYSADSSGLIKLWDTSSESFDTQIKCCGTVDIFMVYFQNQFLFTSCYREYLFTLCLYILTRESY